MLAWRRHRDGSRRPFEVIESVHKPSENKGHAPGARPIVAFLVAALETRVLAESSHGYGQDSFSWPVEQACAVYSRSEHAQMNR